MHQLLQFVRSYIATTCPVCQLPVTSCSCGKQVTDKELTIIALQERNTSAHTDAAPFCSNLLCACHRVLKDSKKRDYTEYYEEYIGKPYRAGLYSYEEVQRIYNCWHI